MDRRTLAIIAVSASALFCAIPGVASLCFGTLAILGFQIDETLSWGAVEIATVAIMFCVGIVGLLIPIIIGLMTLKDRRLPTDFDEPIPPAM